MNLLATIKHISSKNASYGDAESYLTFEHDEFSGKAIRDKNGYMIPREEYRMDTLLCGVDDFAIACMRANLRFGKNNLRGDVKSHHYIISYDPRDAKDHGLTVDRAQELGVAFCKKNFPGHQAMIVTHPDGHNHSGNIHTHIVINSLRIEDVPRMEYMDKACDMKAGMKHRCTSACLRHLRAEVMEMCQENGLYQIDLLGGSKNRVTNKEYLAQRRGQQKLDDKASGSTVSVDENPAKPSKYETDKEKLRRVIRSALSQADSLDELTNLLLQQGVALKESRGRFSYLSADRTKPITGKKLGDAFVREAVLDQLAKNARTESDSGRIEPEQTAEAQKPMTPITVKEPIPVQTQKPMVSRKQDNDEVQRLVDIDKKMEEGKGKAYENWAKVFNIDQMGKTMSYMSLHGIKTYDQLNARFDAAENRKSDLAHQLNDISDQIREKKEFKKCVQHYRNYKELYRQWDEMKPGKRKDDFYNTHSAEIILFEAAMKYFKYHEIKSLPSTAKLQAEIDDLFEQIAALNPEYQAAKKEAKELRTVKNNIDVVTERPKHRDHSLERQ